MEGLKKFYSLHLEKNHRTRGCHHLHRVKQTYNNVFDIILLLISFPDLDKKFEIKNIGVTDPKYDLKNPNSKACFLLFWLFTIEPPLYFFSNEACCKQDKKVIRELGPFALGLGFILAGAELFRKDRLPKGK